MEIESEEDDWQPNPEGTLLDKKIVNFTNKHIKQNLEIFENEEQQFINNIPQYKEDIQLEDEELKDRLLQENLYDPQADYKDEDWVKKINNNNKNQVLSCPNCFTQICFDCQQHETYKNQYRSMFANNVKLDMTKTLKVPKLESDDQNKPELFFSVLCSECLQQVAVYEYESKMFHFFNIIAGIS